MAADLTIPSITLNIPSLGIGSSVSGEIEVNTQAAPVNQTFALGSTPTTLALPAGPFVGVSVTVPTSSPVTLGPGQIAGTLFVEQQTTNGTTADIVGVSNASVWLTGATSPVVTGGQGVFVIQGSGVAGYVSGDGIGERRHRLHRQRPGRPLHQHDRRPRSTRRSCSAARR